MFALLGSLATFRARAQPQVVGWTLARHSISCRHRKGLPI